MTKLNSIHCCAGFFSAYIQKYPFSLGQKLRMILSSFLSSPPHQQLGVRVSAGAFTRSGIIKSCVVGNLNSFFFIIQFGWNKSPGLSEHDLGYDSRASKIYVTDENNKKKKSDVQITEWLHGIRGKSVLMQQTSNSSNTIFYRPDAQLVEL